MKKIFVFSVILLLLCGAAAAEGVISVTATDFPCYDFARQVVGDCGEVTMLIHPGAEVHFYDPSPSDILMIGQSDLFVYIGGESDAWVDSILSGYDGDSPETLRMMDAVDAVEEEGHEHAEAEGPEYDEHIWTSPKNARRMVLALADRLSGIDPENAEVYQANADAYVAQIDEIDAAFEAVVRDGARREVVFADRFPFLYFVRAYGLDYAAAFASCTAETEPTPQTMMALIQRVNDDHIPVIYTIEMSSQAVAQTIAEETGARILTMHSVQSVTQDEFDAGETYVTLMWKNVEALREGLR